MIRPVLVSTVIATLALSACGDSDDDNQASAEEAAATTSTTTIDSSNLEAWCLGWVSPLPDVDQPISNEGLKTVFEAMQAQRKVMLEVAPAEIAETNQSVVDFGRELNAYLAENDWDPNAPRLEGSNAFEAAQRELDQFGDENC